MTNQKVTIQREITSCSQCEFQREERHYTEDSWELAHDWHCDQDKENPRKIQGYISWNEENGVEIPSWCPLRLENQKVLGLSSSPRQ
jgi:hypothetical protein